MAKGNGMDKLADTAAAVPEQAAGLASQLAGRVEELGEQLAQTAPELSQQLIEQAHALLDRMAALLRELSETSGRAGLEQRAEAAAEAWSSGAEAVAERVPVHLPHPEAVNVGVGERAASLAAGVPLVALGIIQRSPVGLGVSLVGGDLVYRGLTGHSLLYRLVGINHAANGHGGKRQAAVPYGTGVRVEERITIERPPEVLYAFWRRLENLPRFMSHLVSVDQTSKKRSHWVAEGPAGHQVSWDAEIISDAKNKRIGWRTLPGSDVAHAGSVRFLADGDAATDLVVELEYRPPAGPLGAAVSGLLGADPARQIRDDLGRLKVLVESGEADLD
jgi:uncharacterized membrane protein